MLDFVVRFICAAVMMNVGIFFFASCRLAGAGARMDVRQVGCPRIRQVLNIEIHLDPAGGSMKVAIPLTPEPPLGTSVTSTGVDERNAGANASTRPDATKAAPNGGPIFRPQLTFFSTAITAPKASIQPRLPAPTTNIKSIKDQQHPTQNSPWCAPNRNDCDRS